MEPIFVTPQPARCFYFGDCFESRNLDPERMFEKSDLLRIRPQGVNLVYSAGNCVGVRLHLNPCLGGSVKAKHAAFPTFSN
jgi:hypothetical protein